jgi:translation initiation factor IF-3
MLVIGADGAKHGVLQRRDALKLAMESGLDLVIVSAEARPPVAKLMDYKKFRFEQKKKAKEIKKNQKVTVVKEVQLSPVIDKHDLETKANIARKFIQKDNKVKVTLRFKGRMIVHQDIGLKVMQEFAELLSDVAQIEANIKLEGKQLFMTLGPKREK